MAGQTWAVPKRYRLAVAATVGLFTIWGLAQPIYWNLSPQFAKFFALDAAGGALSQSLLGTAYFLLAIPAALLLRRLGYKIGLLLGLGGFAGGALLLYPAIAHHAYGDYVAAVIIMGGGYALLETSANPLIVLLGNPRTAVLRLNFAQSFYPMGFLAGVYATHVLTVPNLAVAAPDMAYNAVRPYLLIGLCLVLVAFLVEQLDFPSLAVVTARSSGPARDEFRRLLSRPHFRFGMAAQACCIAAQTCAWGVIPRYVEGRVPGAASAADVLLWSVIAYAAGRIIGTALMVRIIPERLLSICAAGGLVLVATAAGAGGTLGLGALIGTSFFMSIMFPTIFAEAVRDVGLLTKPASGLIVAAGGLGLTLATIAQDVVPSVTVLLAATSLCFAFILSYAVAENRMQTGDAIEALRSPTR